MGIKRKSGYEIKLMREAGRVVALVHQEMKNVIKPGVTTKYLDDVAYQIIKDNHCVPDMATRMKIVERARRQLESAEIVRHRLLGELAHALLRAGGVERVRRVGENRTNPLLRREGEKIPHVLFVDRLRRTTAGVAREKLKDVRADRLGGLPHRKIAARARKMTPDSEHQPTTSSSLG